MKTLAFQSTLPVGGATIILMMADLIGGISIHAPRGGSDRDCAEGRKHRPISIHAPRGGSDEIRRRAGVPLNVFQSTLPVGGATVHRPPNNKKFYISIHAPRGGSDTADGRWHEPAGHFNPRSPWGERLGPPRRSRGQKEFQSTLPVGGATKSDLPGQNKRRISIHAPHGGSDGNGNGANGGARYFNPRSPWGERPAAIRAAAQAALFQSTLPVGGATFWLKVSEPPCGYFNPRSPWGERPGSLRRRGRQRDISIHAPRGGSDIKLLENRTKIVISIHAPRGGSDTFWSFRPNRGLNFNPRSPWGERHNPDDYTVIRELFQSTLPVGGATFPACCVWF